MSDEPNTEQDICMAAEESVTGYLKAQNFDWCGDRIYAGIENEDTEENEGQESSLRQLPCIVVKCETARAYPDLGGNWTPHVDVWMVSNRNQTTKAEHRRRAQQVFSALCQNQIEHALAGEQFFVVRVQPTETGHIAEGSAWVSYMEFDFHGAAAADLRDPIEPE
jgi:hypothetical protein